MLLSTLNMKSDGRITELLKSRTRSFEESISSTNDGRGKAPAALKQKVDHAAIKEHINSYKPAISHYKRESCSKRRYLNPDISVMQMWKDFNSKKPDIYYIFWRKVF